MLIPKKRWLRTFFPQTIYRWGFQFFLKRCPALSRWWCPALRMSPLHLSPCLEILLSRMLAGGVRLSGCLPWFVFLGWRIFSCFPFVVHPTCQHVGVNDPTWGTTTPCWMSYFVLWGTITL
jgi:hypothetical protein